MASRWLDAQRAAVTPPMKRIANAGRQVKENKDHQILDTLDTEANWVALQEHSAWFLLFFFGQGTCIFTRTRGAVTEKGLWQRGGTGKRTFWEPFASTERPCAYSSGTGMSMCGFSTCLTAA